jgi:RNA pol II accessory factor, Cdc73 family, C-terminal
MIQDAATIQQNLIEWIQSRNDTTSDLSKALISDAIISDDGSTITLLPNDIVFDGRIKLTIPITSSTSVDTNNDPTTTNKTIGYCEYTVCAIYLQIRNPKQSLIVYRNDCKKYTVIDPVKAIDKSTVVNYFLPVSFLSNQDETGAVTANENIQIAVKAESITTTEEGTSHPPGTGHEKSERSSSSKHHREKDKHRSSSSKSRRPSSSHSDRKPRSSKDAPAPTSEPPKKKKKPDLVTNEQLFEHLNVVVDKRSGVSQNKKENEILAEVITKALSAHGFEITNPKVQLLPYQERTSYILSNEIPVGNSASILRANNPRKNLSRVLELYMETVNVPSSSKSTISSNKSGKSSKLNSPSKGGSSNSTTTWKQYLVGKKPVIVVPKGMTSPITILNAYEFLYHGRYVSRANMVQQLNSSSSGMKSPPTTFTRLVSTVDSNNPSGSTPSGNNSSSTGLLEYEIIDNPNKLGNNPKEWERIVAVIVLGHSWQFKDWMKSPISYNVPASLFDRVFGYYISMEGDKIPSDVTNWAVKKSQLNRDKRGLDKVTYSSFWNELDEWMKVYKAELLPRSG